MLFVLNVCLVACDTSTGNKRVSFEEFLPIFMSGQQKKDEGSMEDFIEGLKVFDKEGNGFINSAELRHVLTSLGMWHACVHRTGIPFTFTWHQEVHHSMAPLVDTSGALQLSL